MSPTLQEIADVSGCDYDFINNRIRRDDLTTRLKPTEPGAARDFTRQNALEIAFLAALIDTGYKSWQARIKAKEWLSLEAKGKLPPYYVENRKTGEAIHASIAALGDAEGRGAPLEHWMQMLADDVEGGLGDCVDPIVPATRIAVIWLAEIVRRIDELFSRDD